MAKSFDARLARLEEAVQEQRMRRLYRDISAEYGIDPDELLKEAEQFLSMPLAEQLAEVDRLVAGSEAHGEPWLEAGDIKQTLIREHRA
jgi:hypothetical protein